MLFSIVNGLSLGMTVFLVAAGLTLVFGILHILNFAHGHFVMIGAYVAFSILGGNPVSLTDFLFASIAAGLVIGVLGIATDFLVFRRLRKVEPEYMLIATFALLMVCAGAVKLIWGLDYRLVPPPNELATGVMFGTTFMPSYPLFIIAAGVVVFLVLEVVIHRTWIGKLIRSAAYDPWMSAMSGINVTLLYTGSVIAACFLAGLAGGLLLPNQTLSPDLANSLLLHAFVAVIIGGLGDIRGAFIASLMIGLVESVGYIVMPAISSMAVYILMIGFLLWRPQGLLGRSTL